MPPLHQHRRLSPANLKRTNYRLYIELEACRFQDVIRDMMTVIRWNKATKAQLRAFVKLVNLPSAFHHAQKVVPEFRYRGTMDKETQLAKVCTKLAHRIPDVSGMDILKQYQRVSLPFPDDDNIEVVPKVSGELTMPIRMKSDLPLRNWSKNSQVKVKTADPEPAATLPVLWKMDLPFRNLSKSEVEAEVKTADPADMRAPTPELVSPGRSSPATAASSPEAPHGFADNAAAGSASSEPEAEEGVIPGEHLDFLLTQIEYGDHPNNLHRPYEVLNPQQIFQEEWEMFAKEVLQADSPRSAALLRRFF